MEALWHRAQPQANRPAQTENISSVKCRQDPNDDVASVSVQLRAGVVLCLLIACGSQAAAQTPPATSAPRAVFLSGADFYLQWGPLVSSDPRFAWDGMMGVDVDLVEYPRGRLNIAADYEAVLGNEVRPFEINHENFALDASASYLVRSVSIVAAFRHVSRHLSDRPNPNIVAWNVLDVRARRRFRLGRASLDGELNAGRVLQHTFVDYAWTSDLRLLLRRPVNDRLTIFAGGVGRLVGVHPDRYDRVGQCGARLEAGVRIAGRVAALELFAGYERRIDGFPTELTRMRAFAFGFRLTSRE